MMRVDINNYNYKVISLGLPPSENINLNLNTGRPSLMYNFTLCLHYVLPCVMEIERKHEKNCWFWPSNRMYSTGSLVKIHNRYLFTAPVFIWQKHSSSAQNIFLSFWGKIFQFFYLSFSETFAVPMKKIILQN